MRKYKTLYEEVDLDNPDTYKDMPQTIGKVIDSMYMRIGYYYCYVKYWHNEGYFGDQLPRVEKIIEDFCDGFGKDTPLIYFQEQLFLFDDEIENMC